ncbi:MULTISPECIES: sigma factor-like helix-turn-helix DNA-binding protein [unclassified Methanopyrus]|uniref:sigma factor-like helix-turn-helix DNA-binding protein n=1 Tax=unclassified Methanopyrus TaxID=2684913 RepID=UPI000B4ADA68|nr:MULTISPECIES: sigma factor-like helix-turn-helix DNA-binding protein [unclassified Methanopyrus]
MADQKPYYGAWPCHPRDLVEEGVTTSARRARIILRKYVLGQSEEEIAEEEGISLKSVKYHLKKAEEEGLIDYVKEKFVESE